MARKRGKTASVSSEAREAAHRFQGTLTLRHVPLNERHEDDRGQRFGPGKPVYEYEYWDGKLNLHYRGHVRGLSRAQATASAVRAVEDRMRGERYR